MACRSPSKEYLGRQFFVPQLSELKLELIGNPIKESIAVDGAWNTSTGVVEYQGVCTKTKKPSLKSDLLRMALIA